MQPPSVPPEVVRAVLRTDLPLRLLLSTDEFDTWAVGEDLVAKIPRTSEWAAKVASELRLHPLVRGVLGVVVPRVVELIEPPSGFAFLVYERAEGVQGQSNDGETAVPGPGMLEDLARILAALHQVSEERAHARGAGDRATWFGPAELASSTLDHVASIVGDRAGRFVEEDPPQPSSRRVLCHTDVKGEHLFVDGARSRITSLIDWADAGVCDPAKDYAGIAIWLGPAAVRTAVRASGEDDSTLAERAIWLGRMGLLDYWDAVLRVAFND